MCIRVKELTDREAPDWDAFVGSIPEAKIYHLASWKKVISRVFGNDGHYLFAENRSNEICGVLPLVRLKSLIFGDYLVSMPYFNYGGAVANGDGVSEQLMHSAGKLANKLGVSHIEFRDVIPRKGDWPVKTNKVTMTLPLPDTADQLWKDLGSKRRAQIKRPLREDPEIVSGGMELVDDFYRVFSENMRDLGTPVYSKFFFKEIIKQFPEFCTLIAVYLKGIPVGAAFLISYRGTMEIPWASTIRSVNNLGVNMLMYWEALKYAIDTQNSVFDFGRCTIDSGTYRFKKQWGAEKQQLYWHYHLVEGHGLPQLNPENPKYRLAINAWQRLPLTIANVLGPFLVKNLP